MKKNLIIAGILLALLLLSGLVGRCSVPKCPDCPACPTMTQEEIQKAADDPTIPLAPIVNERLEGGAK